MSGQLKAPLRDARRLGDLLDVFKDIFERLGVEDDRVERVDEIAKVPRRRLGLRPGRLLGGEAELDLDVDQAATELVLA